MKNKTFLYLSGFFILILTVASLASCAPASRGSAATLPTPTPITLLATQSSAATPTPFRPLPPDPNASAFAFPTATPHDGSRPSRTKTPTDSMVSGTVPLIQLPEDQATILVLGSDQRPNEGGFRTDVILLVTVNFEEQTISLTSFPRDLYVYLPGYYNDRINTAQFRGGFELTADTFEYNFGVRPDYYAMMNFYGFKDIINTLGGVDVQVAQQLTDHRDGYGDYTVNAGTVHMDGDTALWYVRSRYTSSDFDRTRRQQEVLMGVFKGLLSLDLVTKFPTLFEQFKSTVQTNLTLTDITPFLPVADEFFRGEVGRYAVGPSHVTPWVTPAGAQVLLPDQAAIQVLLKVALNAE